MLLDRIGSPQDLKLLSLPELTRLAGEIRERILEVTARHGGHVAPNLGVVELTIALHYVFDTPKDKIIWDVGHQCYAHKLLTGRRGRFDTLRQRHGLSGFPKREESEYDPFNTGHSSTSLSAALGLAISRDLKGEGHKIVAVIGDGALMAGMAFEALNHVGSLKKDLIIILNDNEMSIAPSEGALAAYLNRIITGKFYNRLKADVWNLLGLLPKDLSTRARNAARKLQEGLKNLLVPGIIFEELGLRYLGPIDGHNLQELLDTLRRVRELPGPWLIHLVTRKGKGYRWAEAEPERFHGIGRFDLATGSALSPGPGFTGAFGEAIVRLAEADPRLIAITAGMCLGTGLTQFRERFPDRFFDVGICEQHAVTLAAGLAASGMRPVVAIYSTFFQRAYDQLIHDVCLQRLPVVFCLDRAGLSGEDGPTHHGPFDLAYLRPIPNLVVAAPKDEAELGSMLYTALSQELPFAIRYPKGRGSAVPPKFERLELGRAEVLREGEDCCILGVGPMALEAVKAAEELREVSIECCVVNVRFVKPLDEELLHNLANRFQRFYVVEEGGLAGGFGSSVLEWLSDHSFNRIEVTRIGLPDRFIPHGSREELLAELGLDAQGIIDQILRG